MKLIATKQNKITIALVSLIFIGVIGTVVSNYSEKLAVDNSKLPQDVESNKEFQKWINNHKKRMVLEADKFKLREKNEVFNSAFLSIKSSDDEEANKAHLAKLDEFKNYKNVRFSPNEFDFLDFRRETRVIDDIEYTPYDVYYHALREDKIIDTKILSCVPELNCYFDRGFFIDNHTFAISEFSRNIHKKDTATATPCAMNEVCTYTIKLHVYDFINSARFVYESEAFDINLEEYAKFF